jgi:hypothetical protein
MASQHVGTSGSTGAVQLERLIVLTVAMAGRCAGVAEL